MTVAATKTGENSRSKNGFTLIELMIVMTLISILAAIAAPNYQWSLIRAREAVLRENLYVIRSGIDQFHADAGRYPATFEELTAKRYLRELPRDPFTTRHDTWIAVAPAPLVAGNGSPVDQVGIYDVQSGSDLVGSNGVPYQAW